MEFFKHPKQVCMTYFEHFCFSMEMAYILGLGSLKAVIHAIYPDFYITSTTDAIDYIQKRLKTVGCR
jgi:hypothetical protein|uniref:Uncharacterized protein n=1 Tax=viral metagenome TaxID=1070528 RepID=A0A6C0ESN4_9ZZZZ